MLLSDAIISLIAIIIFIVVSYLKKDDIQAWQKSIQGKPLSWTDRGQKVNRR